MSRNTIASEVRKGRVLVSDGAWGTFLIQKGLKAGECPELWCLERFDDVAAVAKSYLVAGSDMVQTNSFGASRYKLEYFKLQDRAFEINVAAAKASRMAAGDDHWVIASVGPTGKLLITEEVTEDELYAAFQEQAIALEKGGADALCIETMSDIDEAVLAIKAAKEHTKLEIICTFTFEKTVKGDYRTMMGVTPSEAANAAAEAGAHIIGTNCGNGMERMIDIIKEMRAAEPILPILVHGNAGLPINQNGVDIFPDTPELMARLAPALIEAGANIIGGCCGTTPDHIRAIKEAIQQINQ